MAQQKFDIIALVNDKGCFDLQFRKDTRHERTGSPTYYRWKLQFVVTMPKENAAVLEHVKKELGAGTISTIKEQARFSVQDIDAINDLVVPYFATPKLSAKAGLTDNKKKDFDLWQKAVAIIYNNKGKKIAAWVKTDLVKLLEIHKEMMKFKERPRKQKWLDMAQTLAQ